MTRAQVQSYFFRALNAKGSHLSLLAGAAEGGDMDLGVVDTWRALSGIEPDGFCWITWRSLWFWSGPQFTHIKRVKMERGTDGFNMIDSGGQCYRAGFMWRSSFDQDQFDRFRAWTKSAPDYEKNHNRAQRRSVDEMYRLLLSEYLKK